MIKEKIQDIKSNEAIKNPFQPSNPGQRLYY